MGEHLYRGTGATLPKRFTTVGDGKDIIVANVMTDEQIQQRVAQDEVIAKTFVAPKVTRKSKKIIPWGNKILIRRRKVGGEDGKIGKEGILFAADTTKEVQMEIADVVCVPEMTFCDEELIKNSDKIINAHMAKALEGNAASSQFLMDFKEYLRLKTIQPGKVLFVGKYVGIDFNVEETGEKLSFMTPEGIYGEVVENG